MSSIANKIRMRQDKNGMLRRAIEGKIQMYADKSHFIYELLQNAEDAEARSIEFIQYPDRLEVLHDGKPFTFTNLQGLCDIGKSDKVDSLNQIGKFGVGFKSVFGICDTVRLYSAPDHFRAPIDSDVVPFAVKILDFIHPEDIPEESIPMVYTTRFVFPYAVDQSFSSFTTLKALNNKIFDALQSLTTTTLLFMKNLETIKYQIILGWEPISGVYRLRKKKLNEHCLLVAANGGSNDEKIHYIKFTRRIPKYGHRTVDIAFPFRITKDKTYQYIKAKDPWVSVYFPTKTESKLNFIVQGPYRTTPDRINIPADDEDNIYLAQETAELLRQSILELKEMGKLNMSFVRMLPVSRQQFEHFSLFLPLFDAVKELFSTAAVIPSKSGQYVFAQYAKIARGGLLASVFTDELLTRLINNGFQYYWLPTCLTENDPDYKGVHGFMTRELGIDVMQVDSFGRYFESNPKFLPAQSDDWLVKLYGLFEKSPSLFSEMSVTSNIATSNIIKTTTGDFVAPFRREEMSLVPNVFHPLVDINSSGINIVDQTIYQRCRHFFDYVLHIHAPDEYELLIQGILKRYNHGYIYNEEQHIKDIKLLLKYRVYEKYGDEVSRIIRENLLLRCTDRTMRSLRTSRILLPTTQEGIDTEAYYRNISVNVYFVDYSFYSNFGIEKQDLIDLGVGKSFLVGEDIVDGIYKQTRRGRVIEWETTGEFRWKLSADALLEVLKYICSHPAAIDSKLKSNAIMKILLANEARLYGRVHVKSSDIKDHEEELCDMIRILRGGPWMGWDGRWVFTDSEKLVAPKDISKHDLSPSIYGRINLNSIIFELLRFKKTEVDSVYDLKKSVPQAKLDAYFESELRRRFGISSEDLNRRYTSAVCEEEPESEELLEFPTMNVRSWEALKKHAAEMLLYADPVRYEERLRSVRVSNRQRERRAYLQNVYRYEGSSASKYACQLCHKPCPDFEAVEIFLDPDTELDPMHLCLCPSCATIYRGKRSDGGIMWNVRMAFLKKEDADIVAGDHVAVAIDVNDKLWLWFTQTHFAEIRELMRLTQDTKSSKPESHIKAFGHAVASKNEKSNVPNAFIQEHEKEKRETENIGRMKNIHMRDEVQRDTHNISGKRRVRERSEMPNSYADKGYKAELNSVNALILGGQEARKGLKCINLTLEHYIDLQKHITTGGYHTVGLKSDGTVVAVGDYRNGQCNVSDWANITAVAAGGSYTVGLKSNGTVVVVGRDNSGLFNVSGWTDIIAVTAGTYHAVGLKSGGQVVAVGQNLSGQCDVSHWTGIVAIAAGGAYTAGLKSDGTVVAVGFNGNGQCNVSEWRDIVVIAAGRAHTVGLKSDGTVVAVGWNDHGQCNVSEWTDIVSVAAGGRHTVGLKSDGTVVTVGTNDAGQCEVSNWVNIVAIAAGDQLTVGVKSDGTVVAVGKNLKGQCDVSGWKLFNSIEMLGGESRNTCKGAI